MVAVTSSSIIRRTALVVLLGGLLAGCSAASAPPAGTFGNVMGKVKFKGQPVKEGQVVFQDAAGSPPATAFVGHDGMYVMTGPGGGLKPGTYAVTVTPLPAPAGKPPADPADIPKKYRDKATSGLTYELKEGASTYDIELTP
ncbi:MAG: hypothetical protein JWN70_4781 [Planctomycetaceae bacterium]|nr:hypothetical protein [Planctomycetaceae bacterium]